MKETTRLSLFCGLLLLAALPASLRAQATIYSGTMGSATLKIYDGGYASNNGYFIPLSSVGMQAAVDPTGLTVQFQEFRFPTLATTLTRQVAISVGFGVTKDYTITLNLRSVVYSITDGVASHALTAGSGGNYTIQNTGNLGYVSAVPTIAVAGTYSVTGPTETVTGNVYMPISGSNYMIVPNTLNTNGYPAQLTFSHSNNHFYTFYDYQGGANEHLTADSNDNYFINAVVDGETIQWGFWRMEFSANFGTVTPGALGPVPEPETSTLLAAFAALGLFAYRRAKDRGQS